jgi:hypothetical protein
MVLALTAIWACTDQSAQSGAGAGSVARDAEILDGGRRLNTAAGMFACGSSAMCSAGSQLCEHVVGGPWPGVDLFECIAVPMACAHDGSCACALSALAIKASDCQMAGGGLTVRIDVD